ncbi:MAG: 30S ribosomal protein S12 methylthiotransferase RimO [Rikenellaceae bacterium]
MKKINIITLGCSKNTVDSEHIMSQIEGKGYSIALTDKEREEARIVVINTCGFIADAKEESIDMILEYAEAKNEGLIDHLYVMGCLSERYRDDLIEEIPEVDSFFGAKSIVEVVEGLNVKYDSNLDSERILTTPSHYAYLKISEGCNRGCSYCAIPLIRGRHISVPMETLVEEAENLAKKGVKELLIIAQDTTFYGIDLYGERKIAELMSRLAKVEGLEWIRLHYAYPSQFPEELIEVMANEPKICKYLDIPLQHISDRQLDMMRRQTSKNQTIDLIEKLRAAMPDIALRTTFIVGHCDETQQEYDELIEFLKWAKFERAGVFPYSVEEGTYSAEKFEDNVELEEKERRAEKLMMIQEQISFENNQKLIGKELKVVIDRVEDEYFVGRSQYDSPEVDQEVYIRSNKQLAIGNFYNVVVNDAQSFELYATFEKK